MEKNEVLGEMLYMGLVFEKGRCKSGKIWKYSYIQSLRKHIGLLKEIAACMRNPFQIIEDNIFLRGVCHEILNDKILKIHYPFCKEINIINSEETLITECKDENKYGEIIHFINQLLDDVLLELNKGYRKDKEKIIKTIFAAHNLPRVYLKRDANTLCLLGHPGISPKEALLYSKLSMDEDMISYYNRFFIYD